MPAAALLLSFCCVAHLYVQLHIQQFAKAYIVTGSAKLNREQGAQVCDATEVQTLFCSRLPKNKTSVQQSGNGVLKRKQLKKFLDEQVQAYNTPAFIAADPICIPHAFTKKQDIEIAGFFAAVFAWGNRTTIINKSKELMQLMNHAPYEFITQHSETDLKRFLQFKHRTFTTTDLLYFLLFLKHHYRQSTTLETAFTQAMQPGDANVENALTGFHSYFFSLPDAPVRTKKHVATPAKTSSCKRLNMYLRWMVRRDDKGVDFGLWQHIKPSQLVCPVDVHVARTARRLQLISEKPPNWQTAVELTAILKTFDAADPVRYDFALFGLGVDHSSHGNLFG